MKKRSNKKSMAKSNDKKISPLSWIFLILVLVIFSAYLYFSQKYSAIPLPDNEQGEEKKIPSSKVSDEVIRNLSASLEKIGKPVSKKVIDTLTVPEKKTKKSAGANILTSLSAPQKKKIK